MIPQEAIGEQPKTLFAKPSVFRPNGELHSGARAAFLKAAS
jgi:hypothetical protein